MYQYLGSNADGDGVAPGASSGESGGQEGQSFGPLIMVEDTPGKLQAHPTPRRGAVKGAAEPRGPEVPTPVPEGHSLQPLGCSAAGCRAGQDWPLWGLLRRAHR